MGRARRRASCRAERDEARNLTLPAFFEEALEHIDYIAAQSSSVIPGLDPGIHGFLFMDGRAGPRIKSEDGHDEWVPIPPAQVPLLVFCAAGSACESSGHCGGRFAGRVG